MSVKRFHLDCIAGRANILGKYIIYIFFNFWRGFYSSFPKLFPKGFSFFLKKSSDRIFVALYFIFISSKIVPQIFKIYFKLDILIFLSFMMSFLIDMFT